MNDMPSGVTRGPRRHIRAQNSGALLLPIVSLVIGTAVLVALGGQEPGPGGATSLAAAPSTIASTHRAPASLPSAPRPSTSPHGSPGASVVAITPSPDPTTRAGSPPPVADDLNTDPPDLPRYPGSLVIAYERGVDGRVSWTLLRYRAIADMDGVRAHYRAVFREYGWFVGEVDFERDSWRFVANRGTREVVAEITSDDASVLVTAWVSEDIQLATPEPTQRPGRTSRPDRSSEPAGDEDDDERGDED